MRPSFLWLSSLLIYGYICVMGLQTTYAAQNPPDCTHVQQWKTAQDPIIQIHAPDTFPDSCVGFLSVGPASVIIQPGTRQMIAEGDCNPPYPPSIEVPMVPSVTTGWSLFELPGGTFPQSGSGTLAEFTTIHAGRVGVDFWALGTYLYVVPPWELFVTDRTPASGRAWLKNLPSDDLLPHRRWIA